MGEGKYDIILLLLPEVALLIRISHLSGPSWNEDIEYRVCHSQSR